MVDLLAIGILLIADQPINQQSTLNNQQGIADHKSKITNSL
jgi:hypothetical protein